MILVRKPRISFLLKADTSLHRWEYHSNLQSLLYYSTPLCLSQQQKYDFGRGISLRAFLRQSASGRQTCCRRRRAAKDGEKLGVYKRGKVCYNLCTTQNFLRFFWLFRKAMRPCGDIETAVPAAQYSTIQHTDIRGERSDAPGDAGPAGHRAAFVLLHILRKTAFFCAPIRAFSPETPYITLNFHTEKEFLWQKSLKSFPLAVSTRSART